MNRWGLRAASLFLSSFMAANSFALTGSASGNESLSARLEGQAGVGVAGQSEDPALVYLNPAALTKIPDTQASMGMTLFNSHATYEPDSGSSSKLRSITGAAPNLAMTHRFLDGKLGIGLAAEAPYGLESHWDGSSALGFLATNSKLHMVDITPAASYQITPMVSAGAGADYFNAFDASLEKNINSFDANGSLFLSDPTDFSQPPIPGSPNAVSKLSGTGEAWGFHTGVLVEPNSHHSFGLVYHSKVNMHINGTASLSNLSGNMAALFGGSSYETAAYTNFVVPQNVQMGYAYKPTDQWILEADAAWYDWYSNRDQNVRFAESNPARLAALSVGNPQPVLRRDAWSLGTGANYKVSEKLQLRSGFIYVPYATPESTFSPSIVDLSRYGLALGTGIGLTPSVVLDLAYTAVFYHNRHISNDVGTNTTGDPAYNPDGTFKAFANIFAANITYRFR